MHPPFSHSQKAPAFWCGMSIVLTHSPPCPLQSLHSCHHPQQQYTVHLSYQGSCYSCSADCMGQARSPHTDCPSSLPRHRHLSPCPPDSPRSSFPYSCSVPFRLLQLCYIPPCRLYRTRCSHLRKLFLHFPGSQKLLTAHLHHSSSCAHGTALLPRSLHVQYGP